MRGTILSFPAGPGVIREVEGRSIIGSARLMMSLDHSSPFDGDVGSTLHPWNFVPPTYATLASTN